jgi:hypothetical protein
MRTGFIWIFFFVLGIVPAASEVRLVAQFHPYTPSDPLSGSVVMSNQGDEVRIQGLSINHREACDRRLTGDHMSQRLGMIGYVAVSPEEVQIFRQITGSSEGFDFVEADLQTGDQISIQIPSLLPGYFESAGYKGQVPSCGRTLVFLTAHTDQGDVSWQLDQAQ